MAINNQPRSFQYWAGIGATPNDFNLDSGLYGLTLSAAVWGTAQLQKLLPDGTTYVSVGQAFVANGSAQLQLAAGQYRLLLVGVTTLVGEIALISRGPQR